MDMTGEYRIPAPRERVWQALNDPEILRQAIPGCEELTRKSDTEFEAVVRAKIGPVQARFTGAVSLSDIRAPESYVIQGEGKGGAAGFARGGARVELLADGANATILRYEAKADVGGKLAQIGSRLIQSTAKKMADDFFARFAELVAAREAAPAPGAPAVAEGEAVPPPPLPAPAGPEWAQKPWVWLLGIAIAVAILAYLLAPE
ncbi:hypothetical protein HRbin40_02640 [bacterium HR40]|nr:hypothetical protein HRbin40_02640 [bacterium HR40]